jgi:hypothetical protein
MRFRAGLLWLALTCVPQLALAANPPGEVGAFQAVFEFCTKVDPAERQAYDKQAASLFSGLTPRQIASVRQSPEYKRGYHMLAGVLPELKGNDAVLACQAISGIPKHEARHGPEMQPRP